MYCSILHNIGGINMLNVHEFLDVLENDLLKRKTKYQLGTFFNKTQDGCFLCDCSGLIKAVFWNYPDNGKYQNDLPDINANTMIGQCTNVSTDFKGIIPGELVWMSGHIGVYLRDGVVIECTPKWNNGVQMSYLNNGVNQNMYGLPERKWTKHGMFTKYLDYADKQYSQNTANAFLKLINDIIEGQYGNGQDRVNKLKICGFTDSEIDLIQQCVNSALNQ